MNFAVLSIGDELLNGETLNANLLKIGSSLMQYGSSVSRALSVADRIPEITAALQWLSSDAQYIFVTGGLGPTSDDLTREALALFLQRDLIQNPQALEDLNQFWNSLKRGPLPPANLKQTMLLEGAELLPNPNGTAPGQYIAQNNVHFFLLPGPPSEMEPMMLNHVIPKLFAHSALSQTLHHSSHIVCGLSETEVEAKTASAASHYPNLQLAFCAAAGTVKIYLTSPQLLPLQELQKQLPTIFGNTLLASNSLPEEILRLLRLQHSQLVVAESCTGGLIGSLITAIPGSSDAFWGGVISYANSAKTHFLNVTPALLQSEGAVSHACASAMIQSLLAQAPTNSAAIAITGIAGPAGGSPDKPVGTVWIATSFQTQTQIQSYFFRGSREQIRSRAAHTALNQLRLQLL